MSDDIDEALDLLGYVPKTAQPAEKEVTWLELCKEEGRKLGVMKKVFEEDLKTMKFGFQVKAVPRREA